MSGGGRVVLQGYGEHQGFVEILSEKYGILQ